MILILIYIIIIVDKAYPKLNLNKSFFTSSLLLFVMFFSRVCLYALIPRYSCSLVGILTFSLLEFLSSMALLLLKLSLE